MVDARLSAAEGELEFLLNSGGSVMGLRAQAVDPSGGPAVWDSLRVHEAHMSRRDPRHTRDVARYGKASRTFGKLSERGQLVAIAAYTSRPWDTALRMAAGRAGQHGTLAGVLLLTREASRAYASKHHGELPRGLACLAEWLASEARREGAQRLYKPIVESARAILAKEALEPYEALRQARGAAERDAKRVEDDALRLGRIA